MCPPREPNIESVLASIMLQTMEQLMISHPELFGESETTAPTGRHDEIDSQIETLRELWHKMPEQSLMRMVTNIALYDPSSPLRSTKYPIDGMEDADFFKKASTYPEYANSDGVIAKSNPEACWAGTGLLGT